MIGLDYYGAWCVEEREIARLKKSGRAASSKKNRRVIGRAIRHWQRKLKAGKRSISVPAYGKVIFKKHGRPLVTIYELPHSPRALICFDEYSELTERQIASALGAAHWEKRYGSGEPERQRAVRRGQTMKQARPKLYTLFIRVPDGEGALKLFPKADKNNPRSKDNDGRVVFEDKPMRYGGAKSIANEWEAAGHSVWLWQNKRYSSEWRCVYQSLEGSYTGLKAAAVEG